MRNINEGEKEKRNKEKKNVENSGPLTLLPFDRLKSKQLKRQHSCQFISDDQSINFWFEQKYFFSAVRNIHSPFVRLNDIFLLESEVMETI